MKKILLLALTAVIMVGCGEYYENPSRDYGVYYGTVYIDSCEYIKCKYNECISHKGNCRFCAERRKQELQSIVEQLKNK